MTRSGPKAPKVVTAPAALLLCFSICSAQTTGTAPPFGEYLPLNVMWRVEPIPPDRMTSVSAAEKEKYTDFGAISYIPAIPPTGGSVTYLWRLYGYDGISDHMDSTVEGLDGYTTQGALGFPWTSASATPGLSQLCFAYNASTYDHATCDSHEILPGYAQTNNGLYGYERYNLQSQNIVSTTAGGITIGSNVVSGCALWSWTYDGKEFLNESDFGRLMQSSVTVATSPTTAVNPTEAGDLYSTSAILPDEMHGSPCARMDVVTSPTTEFSWASATSPVQATRAVPLEWNPATDEGAGYTNPVVWKDMVLGKNITLNYNGMGSVAKYTTVIWTPACGSNCTPFSAEIPTAYLTGDFNYQWQYDAMTHSLIPLAQPSYGNSTPAFPPSGYGGIILATSLSGAYAMGVYGVSTTNGGSIQPGSSFDIYNFSKSGSSSPTSTDTWKWAAHWSGSFVGGGYVTFNVYIVTGTLASVQVMMNDLYAAEAM